MAAELRSIQMQLDVDDRLAAAAGGAAKYFAGAAGLGPDAVHSLQIAVIAACEEAFAEVSADKPCVDVKLTWLVDRIEVCVSHAKSGVPPKAASQALQGIDDVRHETRDGRVITLLTKFIKQEAASR